ncbi:MAG: hypothetical protein KAI73_07660 [Rhodospirillaceae bacterium]|nr:hypothetical protein [Rhodospirillaceae bacterium]
MNFELSATKIDGGHIVILTTEKQCDVAMLFMRMQEFYESPFNSIRGKKFTLEQYMDAYCEANNDFDYTDAYVGFNVPGHHVRGFFEEFADDLLEKEAALRDELTNVMAFMNKFALIGYATKSDQPHVLPHELAHALYYLSPSYKRQMRDLNSRLSDRAAVYLERCLAKDGYTPKVFEDEIQAYLSTSTKSYMNSNFGDKKINAEIWHKHQPKYKAVFRDAVKANPQLRALLLDH